MTRLPPPPGSEPGRRRSRIGTGLYAKVVDVLGQEIIDGALPAGSLIFADALCERLGVSRSVVREGIRTLSSMGLLESRPQVGTRVLPRAEWDLLNPHVVRWRAQGPGYVAQMRELLELRLGIEEAAARIATDRMSATHAGDMLAAGLRMGKAFDEDDAVAFFDADARFHRILLEGTDNAVIAQLADTIGAALSVRGTDTRPGMHDRTRESVDRHLALASALVDRDADAAQAAALAMVRATLLEFEQLPVSRASP